jgi:hypothetical protein
MSKYKKLRNYVVGGNDYYKLSKERLTQEYFLVFIILTITISCILFVYIQDKSKELFMKEKNITNFTIKVINLSEKEVYDLNKIFKDIKPIYLQGQKSITITNNLTSLIENRFDFMFDNESEILEVAGFNYGDDIYIEYSHNNKWIKEVICHELLHTYFINNEVTHKIIYDIGKTEVCFKHK